MNNKRQTQKTFKQLNKLKQHLWIQQRHQLRAKLKSRNSQKLRQKPSQIFLNLLTLTKWSWKALILMHSNLMKITKLFLESAHQAGLTNEQMAVVMKAYDQHTAVQVKALQQDWGNDYEANLRFANQAIQAAGLQTADVDSPTFGIRLAAYFGKALQEDMPPQNTQQSGAENIQELIASEAYMDESHPDHKRVTAQVQSYYQKAYG